MPMMHSPAPSPNPLAEGQQPERSTYFGHSKQIATKCGHETHPSCSNHTPWCPACVASLANAKLDAAQKKLVAEGGLTPPEYMRDRRWNQARLKYSITKQRLEQTRKEDQLRWEREQAWDEAHSRYDSQRKQAAVDLQSPAECPVCASMVASYPTKISKVQIVKDVAWWERLDALAVEHTLVPRTLPRSRNRPRGFARKTQASQILRKTVQSLRASTHAADAHRQTWEARFKTESAVRRKHSLGEGFQFESDFWTSPIPGLISRRNHQHIQENQRMVERRARGNILRSKPPRSSLSYSEVSEEVQVDQDWVEAFREQEEREESEREARKVGEEVGYLYFVGDIDGMDEWKEDYLRSDIQLVVRTLIPNSETSRSEDDEDGEYDEMDVDLP